MKMKYLVLPLGLVVLGGLLLGSPKDPFRSSPAHLYVRSEVVVSLPDKDVHGPIVSSDAPSPLHHYLSEQNLFHQPIQPGTAAYRAQVPRVAAFLEKFPGGLFSAGDLIRSDQIHIYTKWLLLEAIGRTFPSEEAQDLLLRLAVDPSIGEEVLITLLSVLGVGSHPTAKTIDYLSSRSQKGDRIGRMAQETLGRMANRIRSHSPQIASRIVNTLFSQFHNQIAAGHSLSAADTIEALGYSGESFLGALFVPYFSHGCPDLRGASLESVSRLDFSLAKYSLHQALREDPSPRVRIQAMEALLSHGDPMSSQTEMELLYLLQSDPDEKVRLSVLNTFHDRYEKAFPALNDVLRQMAASDSSRNVQEAARWYLGYGYFSENEPSLKGR